MTRGGRRLVVIAVMVVGFGPAIGWWLYKKRQFATVDELVAARFKPRSDCPRDFGTGPYKVVCGRCFDGELRPGTPEVLLLCEKLEGTTQVQKLPAPAVRYLLGLWLPAVKVDDAWLDKWRGADDVAVAARVDGGPAIVWKELPSAGDIEARERALAASLP